MPAVPIGVNVHRPSSVLNGPSTSLSDIQSGRSISLRVVKLCCTPARSMHMLASRSRSVFSCTSAPSTQGRNSQITLDVDDEVEHLLGREGDECGALDFVD